MDTNQTEKLKALALAATPGPWEYFPKPKYNEHHVSLPVEGTGMRHALFDTGCDTHRPEADARFIAAANPAAVLELIAEVERLRADVETRDALLRALNAVAIERGDKYGACDCIDNKGNPYPSQHLADVLAAGAPATGAKEKA